MASRRLVQVLALVAVLAAGLLTTVSARAQEREYWLESFHAEILVEPEGSLDVTERLTFAFRGSFNGIYRDIPWRYRTPWGLDYELRITPLAILGPDGEALEHEAGRRGNDYRFKVWVPGAQDAERTVTIRYRVQRGLRFFEAGDEGFAEPRDELYWNVTGFWDVPIRRATARVRLPEGVSGNVETRAYVGVYGGNDDRAEFRSESAREHRFQVRGELEPEQGLTIVVGWPEGAVYRPTAVDEAGYLLADNWPLGLPLVVFAGMFLVHRRWGRDPDLGRSIMVQYEPPGGFRPAELGTLTDERVDLRDLVATVIDLGVRGYLRIEEETVDGWFSDSTKTRLIKLREPDAELREYEREILAGLFEKGDEVALEDLETEFYSRVEDIKNALYGGLTEQGLFRARPDRVRVLWIVLGVATLVASIVLGIALQRPAFFFVAPVLGLIVGVFGWFMPARTRLGREAYVDLKGFEEFLGRTEGERMRALDLPATTFERYLPYAMALGVAAHWARAFEGLVRQPPGWYRGGDAAFDTVLFTSHMSSLNTRMGTAMVTQPRSSGGGFGSSGGSGFSGGFSGGGFGGGGGGAF